MAMDLKTDLVIPMIQRRQLSRVKTKTFMSTSPNARPLSNATQLPGFSSNADAITATFLIINTLKRQFSKK